MSNLAWNPVLPGVPHPVPAAPALRRWSSPRNILVVFNGRNEDMLLFHTVVQARQSGARVVLAYLAGQGSEEQQRAAADRVKQRLHWVGVHCQSTILWNPAEVSVPSLAARSGADRVLIVTQGEKLPGGLSLSNVAERLLPLLRIPVCVIGNAVPPPPNCAVPAKRISLALSLQSRNEMALRFACELCRDWNAALTVVHVFPKQELPGQRLPRTPNAVSSELPGWIRRKTPVSCPLEIAIRSGDPAHEIVAHAAKTHQDLILMCSPGRENVRGLLDAGVLKAVLSEAPCPVLVTGRGLEQEHGSLTETG